MQAGTDTISSRVEDMSYNLAAPLHGHSVRSPGSPALWVDGMELTYAEFCDKARDLAAALLSVQSQGALRVGILGSRSLEALAGVIGTCWAGGAYVPIGLSAPEERILAILSLVILDALVVDRRGTNLLTEKILSACPSLVVLPDEKAVESISSRPGIKFLAFDTLPRSHSPETPVALGASDLAYIEFTSGTTGIPKGVVISAGAVHHYVSTILNRYHIGPGDRAGEGIDLTFDLSVHNMFSAWWGGASLHVVPPNQALSLTKFIRDHEITTWLNVPSSIILAKHMNMLQPGSLPSLRISAFCGEPLPTSAALTWKAAAPNSLIDNLYGPTEATVACLLQGVASPPAVTAKRDVVAIGEPFPGMEAAIVDDKLRFLPPGQEGELALAGPQLAEGYLNAPEITSARFPIIDGKRWYLTGDLALQDQQGLFHHLGRLDNQVKLRGNRIELEEIEAHLRTVAGTDMAAAVAWPIVYGSAEQILGFVAGTEMKAAAIKEALRQRLPAYMVPTTIQCLTKLPLNSNGKIDRKAIIAGLENESRLKVGT